jgi:hypothetical protein
MPSMVTLQRDAMGAFSAMLDDPVAPSHEDANFHGVVVALAIVIVVAGLIEIVRFFISLFL